MMPIIPHISSECLDKLNYNENFRWPVVDLKYLQNENNNIVIQVNGKKRGLVSVQKNIEENDLIKVIKDKELIKNYLNNGNLLKTIYIKNKLINYIIK